MVLIKRLDSTGRTMVVILEKIHTFTGSHTPCNCLDFPEVVCIKRDMAAVRSRFDQQAGMRVGVCFFCVSILPFFMLNLKRRIIIANLKELDAVSSLDCQFEFELSSRCQVNDIKSLQRMLHSFERQGSFPQMKARRAAKRAKKTIKQRFSGLVVATAKLESRKMAFLSDLDSGHLRKKFGTFFFGEGCSSHFSEATISETDAVS